MTFAAPALEWDAAPPVAMKQALANYRLDMRDHKRLTDQDRLHWAALSEHAGDGNVFAQSWFMDAALTFCAKEHIRLIIVRDVASDAWIGILPITRKRRFGRWPIENWQGWSATNQFLGTPLVAPDMAPIFWALTMRHLDRIARGEILLHLRQLAADDAVISALIALCRQQRRTLVLLDHIRRDAHLSDTEHPPAAKQSGKARSRLKSLRARLERDHGPVTISLLPPKASAKQWIASFLEMEKTGWKGQSASALACDPGTQQLFETVITLGHASGAAQLVTLSVGGQPLALSSWFISGTQGFGFKMTYDERYRAYAPGRLLMQHVADHVANGPLRRFDTCARPSGEASNPLWPHKRDIIDCAIAIGSPAHRLMADAVLRARGFRRTLAGARVAMQHMTHC